MILTGKKQTACEKYEYENLGNWHTKSTLCKRFLNWDNVTYGMMVQQKNWQV